MKLTTVILFGLLAWTSGVVKGAASGKREPSVPKENNITETQDESIAQKPFAWLLGTESWGSTDPNSILPKATITTCGGRINPDTDLTYIFYEPSGGFVPNLRCVWALHSHLSRFDIFTETQSSTSGNNGLIMNHYTSSNASILTVDRIPHENNAQYSYVNNNGMAFLMFTSNEIGRGLGVRIAVRAAGSTNNNFYHEQAEPIDIPAGSLNTNNRVNQFDTYLFQPRPSVHTSISIRFLDLEQDHDWLRVFTLIPYHVNGNTITASSYTGYAPFGPPNSETSTEEPRLYIHMTDGSVTKDGVTLFWTSP